MTRKKKEEQIDTVIEQNHDLCISKQRILDTLYYSGPNYNVSFCNILFDTFAQDNQINLTQLMALRPTKDLVVLIELFKSAKPFFIVQGTSPVLVQKTGVNKI